MKPRLRKPAIESEQRLDWLRRNEAGESPPKIAKKDMVDVRTVRKHLEIAKQQAEVKEARAAVLRNALESHYSDLCNYAEKLVQQTSMETATSSSQDDHLRSALRQHLPRSPIWGYLNRRDELQRHISQLKEVGNKENERAVKMNKRLKSALTASENAVIPGIIAALNFQLEQWAMGNRGLIIAEDLHSELVESGFVNLRYGPAQLGKVPENVVPLIRQVVQYLEKGLKDSGESKKLEKAYTDLRRVEKNLRDEIAVITLRRVVPGRCRYCPI